MVLVYTSLEQLKVRLTVDNSFCQTPSIILKSFNWNLCLLEGRFTCHIQWGLVWGFQSYASLYTPEGSDYGMAQTAICPSVRPLANSCEHNSSYNWSWNFIGLSPMVQSCAWRLDFSIRPFLTELCPYSKRFLRAYNAPVGSALVWNSYIDRYPYYFRCPSRHKGYTSHHIQW